jgi:hypothetical protein
MNHPFIFMHVCAILINITYKTTPIVGTSIRMLDGIHTYIAWYGEDKNSCICRTQIESWSPIAVTILDYPSCVRTKINHHKPPSINTENTQFQNMHRSTITIFTEYIPQNMGYMLQERRDELAMYACYTLR